MKAFHEVRTYDSELKVWHANYENIGFLAHWHKEIELIYIRKGPVSITINSKILTAYPGDLILCDSGDIHFSNSKLMDNSLDFIIFDTSVISSSYEYSNLPNYMTRQQLETYNLDGDLEELITVMKDELLNKEKYCNEIVMSSIRLFWYKLKRNISMEHITLSNPTSKTKLLMDLGQLLSYLDLNYHEGISLESAASKLHFSPCHFSRMFKNLVGVNFNHYLHMIRIEHACQFIHDNTRRITDIAYQCGFQNVRSFNRVFKEYMGITPSEYSKLAEKERFGLGVYTRRSLEKQEVSYGSKTIVQHP